MYAEKTAKSQYFGVGEIFVKINFELLFHNQNNRPLKRIHYLSQLRNAHNLAKKHSKHVKLN